MRDCVKEVKLGNIQSNISGVGMGNFWISPIDSTLSWGPFLYQMSLVDEDGLAAINHQARLTKTAFTEEKYAKATDEWGETQNVINLKTDGVDFYNVMNKVKGLENSTSY